LSNSINSQRKYQDEKSFHKPQLLYEVIEFRLSSECYYLLFDILSKEYDEKQKERKER